MSASDLLKAHESDIKRNKMPPPTTSTVASTPDNKQDTPLLGRGLARGSDIFFDEWPNVRKRKSNYFDKAKVFVVFIVAIISSVRYTVRKSKSVLKVSFEGLTDNTVVTSKSLLKLRTPLSERGVTNAVKPLSPPQRLPLGIPIKIAILSSKYRKRAGKGGKREKAGVSLPLFHLPIVPCALSVPSSPASIRHKKELKQQGRPRLGKRHLKSELAMLQTLLR